MYMCLFICEYKKVNEMYIIGYPIVYRMGCIEKYPIGKIYNVEYTTTSMYPSINSWMDTYVQ